MAWSWETFTLPLPRFHHFTFPTDSTLTALLTIVTTLLSFYRISSIWSPDVKYWYSPLSIFLNSLTHFNGQPFALFAEAFFRKSFHELAKREEVVIWRISTRGKWRYSNTITQGFVTLEWTVYKNVNQSKGPMTSMLRFSWKIPYLWTFSFSIW